MKKIDAANPRFIESAISDFQVVPPEFFSSDGVFDRADLIREMTNLHFLMMNKAYRDGNREKLGFMLEEILKAAENSNE
jgi:hypothetical protein